jgi:small subunit ribosomal protein S8
MAKDNLSLMLSSIKNGSTSFKSSIHVPTTKINGQLLNLLYNQGYIRGFFINSKRTQVLLKFTEELKPVIKNIKIISTPGRPVIVSHKTLSKLPQNCGSFILHTNKGLLTLVEALHKYKIGGKVICKII